MNKYQALERAARNNDEREARKAKAEAKAETETICPSCKEVVDQQDTLGPEDGGMDDGSCVWCNDAAGWRHIR